MKHKNNYFVWEALAASLPQQYYFCIDWWVGLPSGIMNQVLLAVCILLIIPNYDCQSFTSNVIPEQINGGSPIVSATDNSNTTMILCELFFGDTPIIITWRLLSGVWCNSY